METLVISNVCTKEVTKFSQKIFAIDVLLEEKPGAIQYTIAILCENFQNRGTIAGISVSIFVKPRILPKFTQKLLLLTRLVG